MIMMKELLLFAVDWSRAGSGEVEIYVKTDHSRVPVKVTDRGNAVEHISFTPREPGLHRVFVYFAKELVRGKDRVTLDLLAEYISVESAEFILCFSLLSR